MSFSADLQAFAKKSKLSILTARNGICLKLFGAVVMDTPVLTGALRGNWTCTLNEPTSEGDKLHVDPPGTKTVARITATINGSTLNDTVVILQNNLDYAYGIEYEGWSHTKAPNGMLRRNLERVVNLVNKKANS